MALSSNTIQSFRLVNLQSWDDGDNLLELSSRGINVLRARSETGKSVFRKACTIACFPTLYGPKSRRALIRRGCDEGRLEILLSNGTKVHIIIKEKKIVYKMLRAEDNEWRVWETPSLPQEMRDELGWYVDDENKILLNIIDSDHGKVFIDTSPKFNAAVLKSLTDEPRVTQARETVSEWIDLISGSMKSLEPVLVALKRECETGKFVDPAEIEEKLNKCRSIELGWASVEEALAHLQSVSKVVSEKPEGMPRDIRVATDCYEGISALTKFSNKMADMISFVEAKPQFNGVTVDFGYCDDLATAQGVVTHLRGSFMEFCKSLASRPRKPVDPTIAEQYYTALSAAGAADVAFREYAGALQQSLIAKKNRAASAKQLREVEEALGVCPLCGARLCEHGTD